MSDNVKAIIDGRDMLPPEPMEKTLTALEGLRGDQVVKLLVYCHPVPLFNILRNNGYAWQEAVADDGTHEVTIRLA